MSGIEKRWSMRLRALVAGTAMVLSLSSLAQAADVTTIKVPTKAGLYPENRPATWEEFGDACEKINAMGKTCLALGMTGVFPKSSALGQIREIIKTPTIHVGVLLSGQEAHALGRGWQEVALGRLTVEDWVARMQTALEESPGKN